AVVHDEGLRATMRQPAAEALHVGVPYDGAAMAGRHEPLHRGIGEPLLLWHWGISGLRVNSVSTDWCASTVPYLSMNMRQMSHNVLILLGYRPTTLCRAEVRENWILLLS